MSLQTYLPTPPIVQEWEQAGLSLSIALNKYMVLSGQLESKTLLQNIHPRHLTARIDSALHSLHTVLSRQLISTRLALTRIRNQLSSVINSLPYEILAEIFAIVIYEHPAAIQNESPPASMEEIVLHQFSNSYSLQSVCRAWRDVILSRGSFWYLAPIYCSHTPLLRCTLGPRLSFERANRNLYLAAFMQVNNRDLLSSFPVSRFHKINLSGESDSIVRFLIEKLLEIDSPFSLCELSLYESMGCVEGNQGNRATVLSSGTYSWGSFCKLLQSLSVFRVRGAHFQWNAMVFSHRLVHVRLQQVYMGSDTIEFVPFLRKLSSSPNLRDLEIISVSTSFDDHSLATVGPGDMLHFPLLGSLLIEDLTYNALVAVLDYISPGSHRLALFLTEQVLNVEGEPDMARLTSLGVHLKKVPVDTLILSGEYDEWLSHSDLHELWRSLPGLRAMKLNDWFITEDMCRSIVRPLDEGAEPTDEQFPNLECLDLSRIRIWDEEWLKQVVISYPIKRMVLGGHIVSGFDFSPLRGNEPIIDWLRINVPDFTLRSEDASPPEYYSLVWQLW